jgi:uncharacterized protein DUF4124
MKSTTSFSASRLGALALGLMLVLSFHGNASAQWKWKDKSGRVQYSDLPPPPGTAEADVLSRPNAAKQSGPVILPSAPADVPASQPKVDTELQAKRDKQKADEAAKRKAEDEKYAAVRADNCSRAKDYQRNLNEGMRIAKPNGDILDDAGRAAEAKRTQTAIESNCK